MRKGSPLLITRGKEGGLPRGFESCAVFEGAGGVEPGGGSAHPYPFTRNRKENKWGYDRTLLQRFGASASLQEIECEFWIASIDGALLGAAILISS